jgi:hypothetical protein
MVKRFLRGHPRLARALYVGLVVAAFFAPGEELLWHESVSAQTAMQFPTTPWGGYAPARVQCGALTGANMNVTTDQAIPISVPSRLYMLDAITINNASVSLTTAAGGFYTAASKGGTIVVAAAQAYSTLTAAANDASGSAMSATIATAGANNALDVTTLYFSLTTAQGAAATADIRVFCRPLY